MKLFCSESSFETLIILYLLLQDALVYADVIKFL
jgi:hypothetical protein